MTTRLRPLGPDDAQDGALVDGLAALLAARHRDHRVGSPLLDPAWEDPDRCRAGLVETLGGEGASGAVALRDGVPAAYLLGQHKSETTWGPNVWLESGGVARGGLDAEAVRDLWAAAAEPWVEAGRTAHYALVPAHDAVLVDAFFRLGFGLQHVHAARVPAPASPLPDGVRLRRAERRDVPVLAQLDLVLPDHQGRSPVFSSGPRGTLEDSLQEWDEDFDDDRFTTFVAEVGGAVVGSAVACALDVSSSHAGPAAAPDAGFLGFAAVLPEARGRRAGRALGEAVVAWAGEAGYRSVVTDWRATNLLSSRTWPRLGFEPTFLRLHRLVGH
ncbi:hypothetical protein GCM10027446_16110 [Angustibacter peucedani]